MRKPSRRAAPIAAKVTKPTNNATRAAVMQGLISAAAEVLRYAAEPPVPADPAVVVVEPAEPIEIPKEPDV
jgi:hypothetical protein